MRLGLQVLAMPVTVPLTFCPASDLWRLVISMFSPRGLRGGWKWHLGV